MSALHSGPHSAGFSATKLFGPAPGDFDLNLIYQVRVVNAAALSTVLITFSWIDENGNSLQHICPLLSLANLTNLVAGSILIRLGDGQDLNIAATLVGSGDFEILYVRHGY